MTVSWAVTLDTASANDVNTLLSSTVIPSGMDTVPLSLSIVDDLTPELAEEFSIELTGVDSGAKLGDVTMATVTILPNDDPNGLFGKF